MKVLAMDTTTPRGSVALTEGLNVIAKVGLFSRKDHSLQLLSSIDFILKSVGIALEQLDAIAVASGPGSFTGIRIGLATAKGLASTLVKPIIPVTALEALAFKARLVDMLICPMIDALRGQVYTALYEYQNDQLRETMRPVATPPQDWMDALPSQPVAFAGDGANRYSDMILGRAMRNWRLIKDDLFLAGAVGSLGYLKLSKGLTVNVDELDGYYIRPSDAEHNKTRTP